jgi:putative transcriptional regulator
MKNNLPQIRAAKQWSQADLAEKLGVSRQTVNAIETGKFHPSLPLAFKFAHLFKLAIEDIFDCGVTDRPSTTQDHPRRQPDLATPALVGASDDFSWD